MAFGVAKDILEQAVEMGVEQVSFSGGEPLEWAGVGEVVWLCASAGVRTEVYTSGAVEGAARAMEVLKENGSPRVILSVYGATEDCHDRITRRKSSFKRMMRTVDEGVRVGLEVEWHFVPLSINYGQLGAVIKLALRKGVNQISVLRFVPQGRGERCSELALDAEQNLELRAMVESGREYAEVRAGSPYSFLMMSGCPKCCAGVDRITILPDCTIYPCDAFKQVRAEAIVGTEQFSRLDKWGLAECWENSPYLQAIREYLTSPFVEPCSGCKYLERCLSGCLAQKYIANGVLKKAADPMCVRAALESAKID
jgi:pyrroloquinoline quinone biosynthesis protein E